MSEVIEVEIDRLEGSLLRILGLVERRGFHIDGIDMQATEGDYRRICLTLRAREGRKISTLRLQIDKLYGVERLEDAPVSPTAAQSPDAKVQLKENSL
jgi:acetolactate synthase regulatory subunit